MKRIRPFDYVQPARYPTEKKQTERITGAIMLSEGYDRGDLVITRLGDNRGQVAIKLDGIEEIRTLRRLLTAEIRRRTQNGPEPTGNS